MDDDAPSIPPAHFDDDEEGVPSGEEEGEPLMRTDGNMEGSGADSSEEEEDDPEEARRIAEGFIVEGDEDDDEDGEGEDGERRRKKKRRRKRREVEEEEGLDEDDLDLVAENTGQTRRRDEHRLKRFRRGSASPPADGEVATRAQDLSRIFDDDDDEGPAPRRRAGSEDDDEDLPSTAAAIRSSLDASAARKAPRPAPAYEDDGLDDFIEEDEDEEEVGGLDEEEREVRRRERREERRRAHREGADPAKAGIDREAWDEIFDIFGNGDDYDWAMDDDEENEAELERKARMEYKDIFEPAQIAERMLTDEDDRIKRADVPERMQLALPGEEGLRLLQRQLSDAELDEATRWISTRIGKRTSTEFLADDGKHVRFRPQWLQCVRLMVGYVLNDALEVPFLYSHRFDELEFHTGNVDSMGNHEIIAFLSRRDLQVLASQALKFKTLLARKESLRATYDRLDFGGSGDAGDQSAQRLLFEDMLAHVETTEEVSDLTEWLMMRYGQRMRDAQALARAVAEGADEPELNLDGTRKNGSSFKKPSAVGQYERIKNSVISTLANAFGISSTELAANVTGQSRRYYPDDQALAPTVYAQEFVSAESGAATPDAALDHAKMLLSHEIGKDPMLKREARLLFKTYALVDVAPTDRGTLKIDDQNPYYAFKYIKHKPVTVLAQNTQYLQMLRAEEELLINVTIHLPNDVQERFETRLYDNYASEGFSDVSRAWNELRREVVHNAFQQFLFPNARLWVREWLREEARELLSLRCEAVLGKRLNVAPYQSRSMQARKVDPAIEEEEHYPNVLAVSHGMGDPRKDAVVAVFLDSRGRFREHATFDHLRALIRPDAPPEAETERERRKAEVEDPRGDFLKLVKSRQPDVIVVNGFSPRTALLTEQLREIARQAHEEIVQEEELEGRAIEQAQIDVISCYDDIARIYQHSQRGKEEYPGLSTLGRYCLALARYVQDPTQEFAALGEDITAINFDPHQRLLPKERLRTYLDRALVTIVNAVGVDINKAVQNSYYQHMLQYVAGLGPRKAQALVRVISNKLGGTLINREALIKLDIMTFRIWTNCCAFFKIDQDVQDLDDQQGEVDALDATRVHPEDYDYPRKMAADALNKHEEDLEGEHLSMPCRELMEDPDAESKLRTLDLDNYAAMLWQRRGLRKRNTLFMCNRELIRPYHDYRLAFMLPSDDDIFVMLTGETSRSLSLQFIVPTVVTKIMDDFIRVRLDSGIEGTINVQYLAPNKRPDQRLRDLFRVGQTIDAQIIDIDKKNLRVELTAMRHHFKDGDAELRAVKPDEFFDLSRADAEKDKAEARKKVSNSRIQRTIKHPNFRNFKAGAAEEYLAYQPRGSVVIRPSSKGKDHLAVTWKVDDGVYQHIDVLELDKENDYTLGKVLRVGDKISYGDLDELIVSHIDGMARKVEEMMNHEKYKGSTEEELKKYLTNWSLANPNKSVYAFGLNRKRPGYFDLSFKANRDAPIETWPVKVLPGAFQLANSMTPDVAGLCNAFKTQYTAKAGQARGGKTPAPYGSRTPYGGGRTPLPGSATPGRATPGMSGRYTPSYMGGATPGYGGGGAGAGAGAGAAYGGYAPPMAPGPAPGPPPAMPPGAAAYGYGSAAPGPPPAFPLGGPPGAAGAGAGAGAGAPSGIHPSRLQMMGGQAPGAGRW